MKIHMIGNAHVDPAWMWRIGEGMEAFISTCRAALDRMDETDEFIFTCSSAAHYDYLLQTEPTLFERIKLAIAKGKWSVVGGWWVEADCNLPSGESFVRQALLGQRFFAKHFGKSCTVGFCVDSFGHNANLPQLLKRAGLDNFVFMRPEEYEFQLDDDLFRWSVPSGDEVTAYRIPLHYSNHALQADAKIATLLDRETIEVHSWMLFYGVGNHGGGPTKKEIASIQKVRSNDERVIFSDPGAFFKEIDGSTLNVLSGELQHHAIGCYSAHSEIKRLNRKAEHSLLVAERMSVLAERYSGLPNNHSFTQAWQNVCFGQFHDLLGGVSIPEAMNEAVSMYHESIAIAERATRLAMQRIASVLDSSAAEGELVFVMNPTAFDREEIVEIELWHPQASERGEILESLQIIDQNGALLVSQKVMPSARIGEDRVKFLFRAKAKAFGVSKYKLIRSSAMRLPDGNCELSFPHLAQAIVLDDATDTWSHGETGYTDVIGEMQLVESAVIENGPIRTSMRRSYQWGASTMIEEVSESTPGEIDIKFRINWQEERKILKYRIAHLADQPRAFYEIPYAVIERPIGKKEHPGQSWVFVGDETGNGIGVINDSKYSYSIDEKYINIVLARSAIFAHHVPPHELFPSGDQRYLDQGEQEIHIRVILGHRNWQAAEMPRRAAQFLEPLIVHAESSHTGKPVIEQPTKISASNVAMNVLKHAEDATGYIVRLVETAGTSTECKIDVPFLNASFELSFTPFAIKTFRVALDGGVTETNLIEL
jgi:alpha-mannosidase